MGQAERLAAALEAVPEEPTSHRLCQDCHERAVSYRGLGICRRCYLRKERHSIPHYEGQCRQPGCPKTGRGRSGYCRGHYQQGWHRAYRWRRLFGRQFGTSLSVSEIRAGLLEATATTPQAAQALLVLGTMLQEMERGAITLAKSPWAGRR